MKRIPPKVPVQTLLYLIPDDAEIEIYNYRGGKYFHGGEVVYKGKMSNWKPDDLRPLYSECLAMDCEVIMSPDGEYDGFLWTFYICMAEDFYSDEIKNTKKSN